MSDNKVDYFKGVNVLNVSTDIVDSLYKKGSTTLEDFYAPVNSFVVLKSSSNQSAICRVLSGNQLKLINHKTLNCFGISPRNKEQTMLMESLLDDDIKFHVITGLAGSGKTVVTSAVALKKVIEEKKYDKLILSKPMYLVGNRGGLGAVPGTVREKFEPYLINFRTNFDLLLKDRFTLELYEEKGIIEYFPVQLMRGASFRNSLIVLDEAQSLDVHEMKTICTRIGENSKMILLGDLGQIDSNLTIEQTGLYKLIQSELIQQSELTSSLELIKGERSPISELLAQAL